MLFFRRAAELERERDTARRDAARAQARIAELERAARAEPERDRVVRELTMSRLLVFTHEGGTFDGLLINADARTLVFADVHRRAADATWTAAAPGELFIDRGKVLYLQRVSADQPRGE